MDDKFEKKEMKKEDNTYYSPYCFQAWVDAFGYHFVDFCKYLPEDRK